MKKDCYIVYSVTRRKDTKQILEFDFINCFETEDQAKASLKYEVDLYLNEYQEKAKWISDNSILLPEGYDPNQETIVAYDGSDFFDKDEPLLKY